MTRNHCRGTSPAMIWSFLLVALLISNGSYANSDYSDTTKNKYPLNDPRNPDCPCHKYQKLADDEYRNEQQNNFSRESNNFTYQGQANIRESGSRQATKKGIEINKIRKTLLKRILRFRKKHQSKYKGTKRMSIDPASCFKWQ